MAVVMISGAESDILMDGISRMGWDGMKTGSYVCVCLCVWVVLKRRGGEVRREDVGRIGIRKSYLLTLPYLPTYLPTYLPVTI